MGISRLFTRSIVVTWAAEENAFSVAASSPMDQLYTVLLGMSSCTDPLAEAAVADSVVARLIQERAALEEQVATLRAARDGMDPDEYEAALEELLIELGLKNREIRQRTGGS